MDVFEKVFNRIVDCLEGICNDIECQLDSGRCHTHKQIHVKTEDEIKNDSKENVFKNNML